jgi:pimeloyl-ACP methyl ester carboxylesterase
MMADAPVHSPQHPVPRWRRPAGQRCHGLGARAWLWLGLILFAAASWWTAGAAPATPRGAMAAGAPWDAREQVPETPVGRQLGWVLTQLNGEAATLREADLTDHFTPLFLAQLPAASLHELLQRTAVEHGPVELWGFAGTPTATGLIARITDNTGAEAAIYLSVEAVAPHRITELEVSEPPGPPATAVATSGPHTGAFDIGGRRLFLTCAGEGSPTVVLESGAGGGAAAWAAVQPALAQQTRVCSYDRANLPGGASDPAPKPRGAADVVADLHALLAAAQVPGPYVLVGHSLGGLYARLYAHTYPDHVVGLVLVDATHEDQEQRRDALRARFLPATMASMLEPELPFVARVADEQVDFALSAGQVRAARARTPLPPLPLVVLMHGVAPDPAPGTPPELAVAEEALWRQLQEDLATLVPGGRLVVAEESGHAIPQEQPELVVTMVADVVAAVR